MQSPFALLVEWMDWIDRLTCAETIKVPKDQMLERLDPPPPPPPPPLLEGKRTSRSSALLRGDAAPLVPACPPPAALLRFLLMEEWRDDVPDATDTPEGLGEEPSRAAAFRPLPCRLNPPPPAPLPLLPLPLPPRWNVWNRLDIRLSTERSDNLSGSYSKLDDPPESERVEKEVCVWTCPRKLFIRSFSSISRLKRAHSISRRRKDKWNIN